MLLTVPHAECRLPADERDCDRLAEAAARALARKLPRAALLVGAVYRPALDLNRRAARWRSGFRDRVRAGLPSAALLLDVHSFPLPDSWGPLRGKPSPELVILDNRPAGPGSALGAALLAELNARGVAAELFAGAPANDVVAEARAHGVPALLLEFYEGLAPARLDAIVAALAAALAALHARRTDPQ